MSACGLDECCWGCQYSHDKSSPCYEPEIKEQTNMTDETLKPCSRCFGRGYSNDIHGGGLYDCPKCKGNGTQAEPNEPTQAEGMPDVIWAEHNEYEADWTNDVNFVTEKHTSYTRTDILTKANERIEVLEKFGDTCLALERGLNKRIKRLEAALRDITEIGDGGFSVGGHSACKTIARQALSGDKT